MTTFTVQVKDKDAELVLQILQKFKAKIIEEPKTSNLTQEIADSLKEVKELQEGKRKPLSLRDIDA